MNKPLKTEAPFYTFFKPPAYVGHWQIGDTPNTFNISITKRPRLLTQLMCRWLLQWVWVDKDAQ